MVAILKQVLKRDNIDDIEMEDIAVGKNATILIFAPSCNECPNLSQKLESFSVPNSRIGSEIIDIPNHKEVRLVGPVTGLKVKEICKGLLDLSACVTRLDLY